MVSHRHLSVLFWAAALLWAVMLLLQGTPLPSGFFKPASTVLGAVVLLIGAFNKWIWRWPILHPWFVSQPDVTGTWKGQLVSTWVNPETNLTDPPIEGYLVIRQTFSSVQLNLITRESNSQLISGKIHPEDGGAHLIAGIYRNTPKLLKRAESPIHFGGILVYCRGNPPQLLDGEYWTDRDTKGELRFAGRAKRRCTSFEDASNAKYTNGV